MSSKTYDTARKGFPCEAIDYIFQVVGKEKPYILDIGCGTGIATKQLLEKGAKVIGTDIDAEMIQQAKKDNQYGTEYDIAPAEKQPFTNDIFDAVTAFSAFHWFATKNTTDEIQRILKEGGWFFAINKNETGNFKNENKKILQHFAKKDLPNAKEKYDPISIMKEDDFQFVEEKSFPSIEYFSMDEALEYIKTTSVWNLVPEHHKHSALLELAKHLRETARDGKIERRIEVVVAHGQYFNEN